MVRPIVGTLPLFRKVSPNKRCQDVVQQIEDAIIEGRIAAGEALPPERALKDMFDISRSSLREALRVLEDRGLIEIKLGVHGGAIVRNLSTNNASKTISLLIRSKLVSLDHLAEMRQDVEGLVSAYAAQRASEKDINRLKDLAEQAKQCLSNDIQRQKIFLEIDAKFHIELSNISGNPLYSLIVKSIHDNIHNYYKKYLLVKEILMDEDEMYENYQYFINIIDALERKGINEAKVLSENHVLQASKKRRGRETTLRNIY